jgi:asparagine synthase (glutamine-hydrolysing)
MLPPELAAAAGLLGLTAAAYLGDEERIAAHRAAALASGVGRRFVANGLLAAAHAHLRTAYGSLGDEDTPEGVAFHAEGERKALGIVLAGARVRAPVVSPGVGAERPEVLRQRGVIDGLRAQVRALRAQSGAEAPVSALLTAVRDRRLTYLSPAKLAALARTCQAIEEQQIPGVFIEAGCALGGSAVVIGSLKRPQRRFEIYDVFGMIPAPGANDPPEVHQRYSEIVGGSAVGLGGDRYYGYEADVERIVRRNLESFELDLEVCNIVLVPGLVQNTLTGVGPVAFAHLDVDWYEPSRVCIERLYPRLSIGGSIVVDDYHDWGGCRQAIDEFLAGLTGGFVTDDAPRSLKITKLTSAAGGQA